VLACVVLLLPRREYAVAKRSGVVARGVYGEFTGAGGSVTQEE